MAQSGGEAAAAAGAVAAGRAGWRRRTLALSRQEAAATATTTAVSDNFLNAFAVHLHASALQMSWLTALPQLVGAWLQLLSVELGRRVPRAPLVVGTAVLQGLAAGLMAVLALGAAPHAVTVLIGLAILYHAALNLNQPHWRAWLGSIVPPRRRGGYFAGRTQLTMLASTLVFLGGGWLLAAGDRVGAAAAGFAALFGVAACGRLYAATAIARMHDPDAAAAARGPDIRGTLARVREALREPAFRDYSLFVAGMQGAVAASAPFFAVYMLRDLGFTYLEYALNSVASIATQFLMLRFWGRAGDRYGNRAVMLLCGAVIPALPALWLVSGDFAYLLLVQVVAGVAWSGFSLAAGNYLYDVRPHHTHFAAYAAVQAGISATLVFAGALLGGVIVDSAPRVSAWLPEALRPAHAVFLVFAASALLRVAVVLWFVPRAVEPRVRHRPALRELVFRVARISAVSGLVLDWLTVSRRPRPPGGEAPRGPSGGEGRP